MSLGLFPRAPRRHLSRTDYAVEDDLSSGFGYDLDSTPEARYDTWWELGPQEANPSGAYFEIGVDGAAVGGTGNQPLPMGVPQDDSPAVGFVPARVDGMAGLDNAGVLAPVWANGAVQIANPSHWYDGGAMEPLWQNSNTTSPQPAPWDAALTLGFGPIETLSGSGA